MTPTPDALELAPVAPPEMSHTGAAVVRRWGWPRVARWLAGGGLVGLVWFMYLPTAQMRIEGVGVYDSIKYERHTKTMHDVRTRQTRRDTLLWFKYYAKVAGAEPQVKEAEWMAPQFFPIAEKYGLRKLRLEPTWPVLTKRFPGVILSRAVNFQRDSSGAWQRVDRWQ
jgi:hypothetical protein